MSARCATLLFFFLFCGSAVSAQQLLVRVGVAETEESVELKSWITTLDQELGYCMDTYSDFIKEEFNTKVDKRGKTILVAEKTIFPEVSKLRLDQRAIFSDDGTGTKVAFTFSPGYDVHFTDVSYNDEFKKAEALIKSYVRYHYKAFYTSKIEAVQKSIKGKQNDIDTNSKRIERNNKSMADNKSGEETEKTKSRNEKMQREIDGYVSDNGIKRNEISSLEGDLAKLNESLRKTEGFK